MAEQCPRALAAYRSALDPLHFHKGLMGERIDLHIRAQSAPGRSGRFQTARASVDHHGELTGGATLDRPEGDAGKTPDQFIEALEGELRTQAIPALDEADAAVKAGDRAKLRAADKKLDAR